MAVPDGWVEAVVTHESKTVEDRTRACHACHGYPTRVRILLVSSYGLPHIGGIEGIVHGYANELGRRGHEVVSVFARPNPSRGTAGEPARRYRDVQVPALNHLEWAFQVPYPVFSPRLLSVLARKCWAADVIHAHGFLYMDSVLALVQGRLARRRRAVRILTEHVGFVPYESRPVAGLQRGAIASVGRMAARLADAIVVYNDRVGDEMRRVAGPVPVSFIPNGIDTRSSVPGRRRARGAAPGAGMGRHPAGALRGPSGAEEGR